MQNRCPEHVETYGRTNGRTDHWHRVVSSLNKRVLEALLKGEQIHTCLTGEIIHSVHIT